MDLEDEAALLAKYRHWLAAGLDTPPSGEVEPDELADFEFAREAATERIRTTTADLIDDARRLERDRAQWGDLMDPDTIPPVDLLFEAIGRTAHEIETLRRYLTCLLVYARMPESGRRYGVRELADQAGLSHSTVARWVDEDTPMNRSAKDAALDALIAGAERRRSTYTESEAEK